MSATVISLIAFASIFGGAVLGLVLHAVLPEHHLSEESRDVVKLGAGFIGTLAALVLGLLVSSAKDVLDTMNTGMMDYGAEVVVLDRVLARFGPEAKPARDQLRAGLAAGIERIWPKSGSNPEGLRAVEGSNKMEDLQDVLRRLAPQNELQRALQSQAVQISGDLSLSRWRLIEHTQSSLPTVFLIVLVFWLTLLFVSFGLLASHNGTVSMVLLVCALSVSGAIFLILEMNAPLQGVIKISSAPMVKALDSLGK
jgi:hypothetical protein